MIRDLRATTTMNAIHRAAAAALALGILLGGVHAQQDKVVSKDGKERTVKIESEDYDGLKLSVQGGSMTMPWKDVDSIRYGNAAKYQEAVDAFGTGGPAQALPLLEPLAADDKLRPVLRHGVLYHLGLAQKRLGDDDKSIATFEALLKDFPKSRHLITVGANVLDLYVAKGDPAGASKTLDAALRAAGSGAGQQAGFDFLRGRVLEEQKKYPDAERVFQGVVTAAGSDQDLALAAKLALARCAQHANRTNEAQTKFREIVALAAPNEVMAGAWNGLGEMALVDGTSKRSLEELRYALFAFLRGVVYYVPERGGSTEEYERSLAGSARAFRAIGELDTDPARKKLFLGRAQQRREQLAAEYPRSRHLAGL